MIEIVEEGTLALEQAKDGQKHAAKIEFASGITPEDVDLKRTEDCRFSPSGNMIAVAGFVAESITLFKLSYRRLSKHAEPSGRLMGSAYPHGVRFIQDGRGVLVADAGAPLVHYWHEDTTNWQGDHQPTRSFKIMDDATFLAGRHNAQEGGPKGLDIHPLGDFLVLTSEQQGFAAFDLSSMLATGQS